MKKYSVTSSDSTSLSLEVCGGGETALLFIHGWLGNKSWWSEQMKAFQDKYLVAAMDLAGHGESSKTRKDYSSKLYADDIVAAAKSLEAKNVILIGHSMSGAYVLEAAPQIPNLKALVVVDTLKDLDFTFTDEQINSFMDLYDNHFAMGVESVLPQYLFVSSTPKEVVDRLKKEFLAQAPFARVAIEPLYRMDLKRAAQGVKVPVKAINSDHGPTNEEANKKYIKNYAFKLVKGTGHYPMMENAAAFNQVLEEFLNMPLN